MSETYFEMDSKAFEDFLKSCGFTRTVQHNEVVYFRLHHKLPHLMVKIYTTISDNSQTSRSRGADAIRIVAVFDNGERSFGVGKFPRVYRRAPHDLSQADKQKLLHERTYNRMRDAYARCNEWLKEQQAKRNR